MIFERFSLQNKTIHRLRMGIRRLPYTITCYSLSLSKVSSKSGPLFSILPGFLVDTVLNIKYLGKSSVALTKD